MRNKLWALRAAVGSVLVRDGARGVPVNAGTICVSLGCVLLRDHQTLPLESVRSRAIPVQSKMFCMYRHAVLRGAE